MADVTLEVFVERVQELLELAQAGRLDNTSKSSVKFDSMDDTGAVTKVNDSYKASGWPIPPGPPSP